MTLWHGAPRCLNPALLVSCDFIAVYHIIIIIIIINKVLIKVTLNKVITGALCIVCDSDVLSLRL